MHGLGREDTRSMPIVLWLMSRAPRVALLDADVSTNERVDLPVYIGLLLVSS